MKLKYTLLVNLFLIVFLYTSCVKESNTQVSLIPYTDVKDFSDKIYTEWAHTEDSRRSAIFREKIEKLNAIASGSKSKTATQDEPLDQAFLSLEGILSNVFAVELNYIPELIISTDNITIPVYEQGGELFVTSTDYYNAYSELYTSVSDYYQSHTDEECFLTDLIIDGIHAEEGYVSIRLEIQSVPSAGSPLSPSGFLTPTEPYRGAKDLGNCQGTAGQGLDAADFIGYYANATAPWKIRCTNRAYFNNRYSIWGAPRDSNDYWHSATNDCIGYYNEEWEYWYSKIDLLIADEKAYGVAQGYFQPNYEFLGGSYFGREKPLSQITDPNFKFVHEGDFTFGIATCY